MPIPDSSPSPVTSENLSFKIIGMDCAEEVATLRSAVGPIVGGAANLSFDILNGKMTVLNRDIAPNKILEAVARTGMTAQQWSLAEKPASNSFWKSHERTILTSLSGCFVLTGFFANVFQLGSVTEAIGVEGIHHSVSLPARICYILAIIVGARFVLPKAFFAAKRLRPDMNLLMTIAVIGAVVIGELFEGATVAFLFTLSLTLESWSVGRARRAVAALMDLSPPTARLFDDKGNERLVPPDQLPIGTVFTVKPGDRIPLDGHIVSGTSDINQAPITGESMRVSKSAEDEVFAGTINGDGLLQVKSSKLAQDTTLAKIIHMVGEAQSQRAPAEQWVEKFARIYTPVVMTLAVAVLLLPPLLFDQAWGPWFYHSLVLLVIACPCALVISTPVSIVAALATAARNGILIKGGAYIEAPASLRAMALDKTGTLTTGKPVIVEIIALNGHNEKQLLERAAALEVGSTHPIAIAILAHAKNLGVEVKPAANYQIIQGKGAQGEFDGKYYWLGSHRLLEEKREETSEVHQQLESMATAGCTVVVVGNSDHVCGFIALADGIRPEAKTTIKQLHDSGIENVVMLTGDNQGTANAVARAINITQVHAELLPEGKVKLIEELAERYESVAMVGDGINDAPAMGRATLAIAMGAAGSDAAIETADIALMSDDLSKLTWLIHHSRRTMNVIRQNIAFSLTIKAIFVILTFSGFSSLWAAIAADMGASLLVVFNGLRLLRT